MNVPLASRAHHELHQFAVAQHVEGGLADPAHPERDQRPEQFLGRVVVGGDVVVHEEQVPAAGRFDLLHEILGVAVTVLAGEEHAGRAVVTQVGAAAGELQEGDREVALAAEQVSAWLDAVLDDPGVPGVAGLQASRSGVLDHLPPDSLGVPGHEGVAVLRHLVGDEGRVHPAHDDPHAAPPVLRGDLVGPAGRERLDCQRDQVDGVVVGDCLAAVVVQHDLDVEWGEAREDAELQGLHAPRVAVGAGGQPPQVGLDERDLHAGSPPKASPCLARISRPEIRFAARWAPRFASRAFGPRVRLSTEPGE